MFVIKKYYLKHTWLGSSIKAEGDIKFTDTSSFLGCIIDTYSEQEAILRSLIFQQILRYIKHRTLKEYAAGLLSLERYTSSTSVRDIE